LRYKATSNPVEANQIARLAPFLGIPDRGRDEADALAVSTAVAMLVEQLGLKSTLTEYNVPHTQEEMEAIAERALRTREHDDFNAVVNIVKELF
jgi:alcohol dehydrogenase class IV